MSVRYALFLASCLVFFVGCQNKAAPRVVPVDTAVGTVLVEFIKNDTKQDVVINDVADGTTLEDVMRKITDVPIELSGSGLTAFVNSIDGVATNQSEGWTYRIDGKYANLGIGSNELHPPTTVTWRFGAWDESPESE